MIFPMRFSSSDSWNSPITVRARLRAKVRRLDHNVGYAAAYQSGEGRCSWRADIAHTEMVLGPRFSEADLHEWDSTKVWNEVDKLLTTNTGKIGVLEFMLEYPGGLDDEDRIDLAFRAAKNLIRKHGKGAVGVAIHAPPEGRFRYRHVHLITTDLVITPAGVRRNWRSEFRRGLLRWLGINMDKRVFLAVQRHWVGMTEEFTTAEL